MLVTLAMLVTPVAPGLVGVTLSCGHWYGPHAPAMLTAYFSLACCIPTTSYNGTTGRRSLWPPSMQRRLRAPTCRSHWRAWRQTAASKPVTKQCSCKISGLWFFTQCLTASLQGLCVAHRSSPILSRKIFLAQLVNPKKSVYIRLHSVAEWPTVNLIWILPPHRCTWKRAGRNEVDSSWSPSTFATLTCHQMIMDVSCAACPIIRWCELQQLPLGVCWLLRSGEWHFSTPQKSVWQSNNQCCIYATSGYEMSSKVNS